MLMLDHEIDELVLHSRLVEQPLAIPAGLGAILTVALPSTLRMPAEAETDDRSKSSVVVAMYQPRFCSPSRPERGTRTLSKKTSLKPVCRWPG